jgi:hypothetical protein
MEARDYAYLWAWEPLHPADLAGLLAGLRTPVPQADSPVPERVRAEQRRFRLEDSTGDSTM